MVTVVIQYIKGCPGFEPMLNATREAIKLWGGKVDYSEVIVQTCEEASELKFRGSPTLLINDRDFEGLPEIRSPGLTCRYYADGLPGVEDILLKLNESN